MSKLLYLLPFAFFLVLIPNLSFTPWPEMLSRPFLLMHGWLPYKDIVMEHSPLLLYDLAIWFKLLGVGIFQLKLFTISVIFINSLLILFYLNKSKTILIGLAVAIFYLLLCLGFEGFGIWFDLGLTPIILIVFLLTDKKWYFLAGLTFGLALLVKQSAVYFIVPILFSVPLIRKNIFSLFIGIGSILLTAIIVFYLAGFLPEFLKYATGYPAGIQLPTPFQLIYFAPFILLLLPVLPLKLKLWTFFGALGIFPRWGLFHLQPALPFLAILFGFYLSLSNHKISKVLYLALISVFLYRQIHQIWQMPDRFSENSFLEAANYVKENTEESDKILVLNTWESLYALADRLPASKPLFPYLPWYLDKSETQTLIVSGLKSSPPVLVIRGELQESGLGAYQPEHIVNYVSQNYFPAVKIDSIHVLKK